MHRAAVEWQTLALIGAIYGLFGLLTWFHASLPWWLLLPLGAYVVAWHSSLQHEVVHGHPTRWPWANRLLVLPNLWLWVPFEHYREVHLAHHVDDNLTDPDLDPESGYLHPEDWAHFGKARRSLCWINNTLLGRMVLGPGLSLVSFFSSELLKLRDGRLDWRAWGLNLLGAALVLAWVVGLCGMAWWQYLLFFVYPGIGLSKVRSFLEHQARPEVGQRTVIVEAGPLFGLLFLNNNLHVVHHAEPDLPWYALPRRFRERREAWLALNGQYRFSGYAEVFARYLLWPKENVAHPLA